MPNPSSHPQDIPTISDLGAYRSRVQRMASRVAANQRMTSPIDAANQPTTLKSAVNARLAILLQREAIERRRTHRRARRWLIGATALFVVIIAIPLAVSALSIHKQARAGAPASSQPAR